MPELQKPIPRSAFRLRLGMLYYGSLRKLLWLKKRSLFASVYQPDALPFSYASHKTILRRQLKDVDMWMQENKITNLTIAPKRLNTVLLRPGEVFSYWKLIGKPTKRKGYLPGMILRNGTFQAGVGGGLCQLSNLIFWMTLHTPLTVLERHRHGYDVFPDSNCTQPFGSGATCFYPHGDLMLQNNTQDTFQLLIWVGADCLEGEWRVSVPPQSRYEVVDRNHEMRGEYCGGYSRHNQLYQRRFSPEGQLLDEKLVVKNSAIMMYAPFLPNSSDCPS